MMLATVPASHISLKWSVKNWSSSFSCKVRLRSTSYLIMQRSIRLNDIFTACALTGLRKKAE